MHSVRAPREALVGQHLTRAGEGRGSPAAPPLDDGLSEFGDREVTGGAHPRPNTPPRNTGAGASGLADASSDGQHNAPPPRAIQNQAPPHLRGESHQPHATPGGTPSLQFRSANVQKSRDNHGLFLENNRDADILFIQEPFKGLIKTIVSTTDPNGDGYFHTTAHHNFMCLGYSNDTRVLIYINKKWRRASPQVRTSSVKHKDVLCVSMRLESGQDLTLLNVYNDSRTFEAVEYLLDRVEALPRISVMAGDFNLRDPLWDARQRTPGSEQRHLRQREQLKELAQEHLGLTLLNDPDGPPTWLSNNLGVREGVLDLVWTDPAICSPGGVRVNDLARHRSDHAVMEWTIQAHPPDQATPNIKRGSIEGATYVRECRALFGAIPDTYDSRETVEQVGNWIASRLEHIWNRHATTPKPSHHSKSWWSAECSLITREIRDLRHERSTLVKERRKWQTRVVENGPNFPVVWHQEVTRLTKEIARVTASIDTTTKQMRGAVRRAKREFFDQAIKKTHPARIWDLVGWTRARPVSATTGLVDREGNPVDKPEKLAELFQEQFTPANPRPVDPTILDEIPQLEERTLPPLTEQELLDALRNTKNFSAPGPDNVSWFWLKRIISDEHECTCQEATHDHKNTVPNVVAFFNACLQHGIHPTIFKRSRTVVIPKPNKDDYSLAKAYRPIVLLNCLGKLLEKMVAQRMQFDAQRHGLLHPCQFGGTLQHNTQDAGIQLIHNIRQAWARGIDSTALLLDVAQFFPSVHHGTMASILRKQGFPNKLCQFFEDYLVNRQTEFIFNGYQSAPTEFSTGVGQGSALSPVLTGLYIAPVLHLAAPVHQTLEGNASLQFFVDDGMIHVAGELKPEHDRHDGLIYNNWLVRNLFHNVISHLARLGLGVEPDKLELMHFRRAREHVWNDREPLGPNLKLRIDGRPVTLKPKTSIRYLGFYLDPKLTFREHTRFYATKAASAISAMRMLGNSARGLSPTDKRRLYISNVLPVLTYGAQLWWHPGWTGRKTVLRTLQTAQNRAARWITGGFRTTPTGALEMMAGLLPVRHQIDKYMRKACLRTRTLHSNHPTRAQLPSPAWTTGPQNIKAPLPLRGLLEHDASTPMTHIAVWGSASNEMFEPFHRECRPGERILDTFKDQVSLHMDRIDGVVAPAKAKSAQLRDWINLYLNPIIEAAENHPRCVVLYTDGSQKRTKRGNSLEVAAGAAWLVKHNGRRQQGRFGCGKATPYDAEMAALARGLKEAVRIAHPDANEIHVFADNQAALASILAVKKGPAQLTSIAACSSVRAWLEASEEHHIHLWWCPGHHDVPGNVEVDREAGEGTTEASNIVSYAYARQEVTAQAYRAWQGDMDRAEYRGRHNMIAKHEFNHCKHTSANWFLKTGGKSNTYFARMVRFVSGHFPHGQFRDRFHLEGPRGCWCGQSDPETRDHTWFDCKLWIRKHKPPDEEVDRRRRLGRNDPLDFDEPAPDGVDPVAHYIQEWRKLPPDMDTVAEFLRLNPMVGTFAWTELTEQASADRENGDLQSLAILKVTLHTEVRKRAYERWVETHPADLLTSFNHRFAKAAVKMVRDRFELDLSEVEQVEKEFGLPGRKDNRAHGTSARGERDRA